ncbi:unnamed protein product [Pleuronectes platessa]|uniref:Uncharacterized protein n=1 Tax=Pleuronectes platessa TaxID=8262 RepID=A0A9N7Z2M1_PLEPL|nr:unnamed protein product [Pleuronectes platessa]
MGSEEEGKPRGVWRNGGDVTAGAFMAGGEEERGAGGGERERERAAAAGVRGGSDGGGEVGAEVEVVEGMRVECYGREIRTPLSVFRSRHLLPSSLARSLDRHRSNYRRHCFISGILEKLEEYYRGDCSPRSDCMLMVRVSETSLPRLTRCFLSVRKLVIHLQVGSGKLSCVSLSWRRAGAMVLNAELKSKNRILA